MSDIYIYILFFIQKNKNIIISIKKKIVLYSFKYLWFLLVIKAKIIKLYHISPFFLCSSSIITCQISHHRSTKCRRNHRKQTNFCLHAPPKVLSLKAKCLTCHKLRGRATHQHVPCQTHLHELNTLLCHMSTPDSNTSTLGTTLAMAHHHRLQSTFNTILAAMSLFFWFQI